MRLSKCLHSVRIAIKKFYCSWLVSADRAFHLKVDEAFQLDGVFHGEFADEVVDEAVDGEGHGLAFVEAALAHVFGYSVMIDVSARDNRRAGQWIFSKGMDSYAPFGPVIVTADEIPDPQKLDLWLTVNGVEKQRSNTAKMLFKVDELIADISQGITLEPGDIIASGTPEGVGALQAGDRIDGRVLSSILVEIEGLSPFGIKTYIPEPQSQYERVWTDKPASYKRAVYNNRRRCSRDRLCWSGVSPLLGRVWGTWSSLSCSQLG